MPNNFVAHFQELLKIIGKGKKDIHKIKIPPKPIARYRRVVVEQSEYKTSASWSPVQLTKTYHHHLADGSQLHICVMGWSGSCEQH